MLVLAYDYPPNDGGISRLGAGIVAELARRGRRPEVVTLRAGAQRGLARPAALYREVAPARLRRDVEALRWLIATRRDAPVLATVWNPEASLALLARRRRVTILAHGNEVMPYSGKSLKKRLRRHVLEGARAIVCNSRYTEGLVRAAAPFARTFVINPAVDAERFDCALGREAARARLGLPKDRQIVLSLSRLDAMKGHDTILRAIAALDPADRARLYYVIGGRGAQEAALRAAAAAAGLGEITHFAGFVDDADLPALYRAADLFALCSIEDPNRNAVEGFGMTFTEAQSAGLAALGTRSGGIPDAIREGEGGWLVAEHDHEAVAAHLRRLVADPDSFHREGALGRARVLREMSWASYVDSLLQIA
jgi:phosphatidylinositol alpha-1,6-mannosyltransferase